MKVKFRLLSDGEKKKFKISKCKPDTTGIFFWQHKINSGRKEIVPIKKNQTNSIICLAKFVGN